MESRHSLVDVNHPSPYRQPKSAARTNWELWILCQPATAGEYLQWQLSAIKKPIGSGSASLAEDLLRGTLLRLFMHDKIVEDFQHIPLNLQVEWLDGGEGVEEDMLGARNVS